MNDYTIDVEELRQKLFDEVYAMAFSGMPAAFLDENKIKYADKDQLIEIGNLLGIIE